MWKRGEIAPKEQFLLFSTLFYIYIFLTSGVKLHIHLWNVIVQFIVFLTLSNLLCRGTDISKYFSESLEIRYNEGRLYSQNNGTCVSFSTDGYAGGRYKHRARYTLYTGLWKYHACPTSHFPEDKLVISIYLYSNKDFILAKKCIQIMTYIFVSYFFKKTYVQRGVLNEYHNICFLKEIIKRECQSSVK